MAPIDPVITLACIAALFASLVWIAHLRKKVASAQARMDFLLHSDPLTGLPNHMLARDRLERLIAYASRGGSKVAVTAVDVDDFKSVNDSAGHLVGDALIQDVAGRLRNAVRDSDTVSRQNADEFLVLLGDIRDVDATTRVAGKLQDALAHPF
ncbi:MAG TPA: GGDEF domain-containing protein, partial [Candidatus Omnitrophota bacterium]|nr:GGDEF domain-containing protein [Candidatus Omnitrophota bacterium]